MTNQRKGTQRWWLSVAIYIALSATSAHAQENPQANHAGHQMADHSAHQHRPVEMPKSSQVPTMALSLFADEQSGFNLHIQLEKFLLGAPQFAPEQSHSLLAGHGHLFVNGEKRQRLYGPDVHLPASWFKPGLNQISVTLNDHDHNVWTHQGNEMVATLFINNTQEKVVLHHFSSIPPQTAAR